MAGDPDEGRGGVSALECLSGRPWAVLTGDCVASLAALPADSIDACVTDTPYGLSTILDPPNLDRETLWRRLTEGTSESPIKTLMRAWLDTGDNPKVKGRGFMGKEWDALVPSPNTWRAIWRVLKPGAYCFAFGGTRTYALIEMSLRFADFEIDDGICTWLHGQGFPKRVRLDLKIDQHFGKAGERPVVGRHPHPAQNHAGNAARFNASHGEAMITAAATPEAARFVGWDRALRPGWEPIIVATKPRRGTVAENALSYGTGGLHVDACRLPRGPIVTGNGRDSTVACFGEYAGRPVTYENTAGGYPANVVISEEVAEELDRQSGVRRSGARAAGDYHPGNRVYGGGIGQGHLPQLEASEGGASRFFYVAKASSSERDAGLDDLPPLTAGERCDREDGTAGVNGYAGTRGEGGRNPHPTVKPIALMRWLCRLASPPGANDPDIAKWPVILDPFAGSGSTGVAAMREGLRFVGCEMDTRMSDVMRRRLQHAYALTPDERDRLDAVLEELKTLGQRTLF